MTHAKFGNRYVLRLYRDEDIIPTLTAFVRERGIPAGELSGIGAVREVILGYFDLETRKYIREEFPESCELAGLSGNLSQVKGEPFFHLHATIADRRHTARAGHLFSARVSVTLEVVLTPFSENLERTWDQEVGLNLLNLP
ncbi:MAG: PPC domain-containing DNA-binding protein [Acidobacteriota bacterium]